MCAHDLRFMRLSLTICIWRYRSWGGYWERKSYLAHKLFPLYIASK